MNDSIPTKERLAQALREAGLLDLEHRARNGEFDDYESDSATPKIDLIRALLVDDPTFLADSARTAMADRVKNGEFDNTREEWNRWFEQE